MSERDPQNRKLAEWLEPMPTNPFVPGQPSPLGAWRSIYHHDAYRGTSDWVPPDFFTDEAASAMVRDKLLKANCIFSANAAGLTIWSPPDDRKTASERWLAGGGEHWMGTVALAALAYIDSLKEKP